MHRWYDYMELVDVAPDSSTQCVVGALNGRDHNHVSASHDQAAVSSAPARPSITIAPVRVAARFLLT